jgi:spore coat polysaccharide biosynthesis protein SpsF
VKRVVMILQARMGSTRLPGKSAMDLAGAPLLSRILERLRRCEALDEVVVATTDKAEDDVIVKIAHQHDMSSFRGSENDLVDRYYQAALTHRADAVVRFPADNPVPEPSEIDRIVRHYLDCGDHFCSNIVPFMGNGYPDGIGAEVIDVDSLAEVWEETSDPFKRENPHLNFFDYGTQTPVAPERYRVSTVQCHEDFARPDLVLDVDTREDYGYMAALYRYLYPRNPTFHITDVIHWHDHVYEGEHRRKRQ